MDKKKEELKIYKIRRKDGLFSSGGSYPSFERKGKAWTRKGDVTSHVSQLYDKNIYKDCDVVEYELKEIKSTAYVVEYFDKLLNQPQSTMHGGLSCVVMVNPFTSWV